MIANDNGYLLFQSFDGGEQFEDHQKDEEEAGQDDGIDVAFDADKTSQSIADIRKCYDNCHTAPDKDADSKLEECLATFALEIMFDTLTDHQEGEDQDDDLIEGEGHRVRVMK